MFRDRADAGRRLAAALAGRVEGDVVVLGVPRGGVLVAGEVARALAAPLDVVIPRKIGAPQNPELAVGAIAPGVQVWEETLLRRLGVSTTYLAEVVAEEEAEIERRAAAYRGDRPPLDLRGRTAVIVDDGIATGATAEAAARWAHAAGAVRVVLAVPVAAPEAVGRLARVADEVVALEMPFGFRAVGEWYDDFGQTTDDEVVEALGEGRT
jgi:predicted phosphoribosyltransferase